MSGYLRTVDGHERPVGERQPQIECFRCGICCTRYQPPLTHEESETIAKGLGISTENFLARYAQLTNVGYLVRQLEKGCVFLTWKKEEARASCSIYPFRPEACRNWAASLSRSECREGLAKLKAEGKILLIKELYPSPEAVDSFSKHLSANEN